MHTVNSSTLGPRTLAVIHDYLALPFGTKPSCPYFNNRRAKIRGSLRVIKGKGTPKEIIEEAEISALYTRVHIETMSKQSLKEFLVEQHLGIDCSGFAYHVLDAHAHETTRRGITNYLCPINSGFVRSIINKLRPAENTGVGTFAHEKNSSVISLADAKPGDIITFIGTGKDHTYNHILIVTTLQRTETSTLITYAHSYTWPSDGLYNHGVRTGTIETKTEDILTGTWTEQGKTGDENYTLQSARTAQAVSLRRLRFNM